MANNTLLDRDSFQRPSENPLSDSGKWVNLTGYSNCQITAGSVAEATAITTNCGVRRTGTWPNDQISEITVAAGGTNAGILVLIVRAAAGSANWYQLNIQATPALFKTVNGTPTTIQTFNAYTPAAGDVWTLQAAGAMLSVYLNNQLQKVIFDTTFSAGSPGIGFYCTAAVTAAQLSAWRGYSCVQQDGIWQKQGIVMPAIAGDLSGTSEGTQNPSIIGPETGKLLTGQSVWKMYFCCGAGSTNVGYAESPVADGINWTRGSNVVTGVGITVSAIKVGSTYHLYCQAAYSGNVQHFTSSASSSGFTLQSNNVFAGTAGLVYFSVVAIITGTWYALYTINTSAFPATTNLATSADGIAWSAYGSNPVASNWWGVITTTKIGSTYYAWGQTVNPSPMEANKPGIDPGEGLRMQTTDFITWTNPIHSIHHSQIFEGLNYPNGGAFVSFAIDIGGKAYLYYSAGNDDAIVSANSVLQIALAIAPVPIASVVGFAEDAAQQVATDNFTRANGTLGANWTTPTGGTAFQIASNKAEPTTTGALNHAVYTGASFNNDQYAEITITTLAASSFADPAVRMSTSALTFYQANIGGPTGSTFTAGIYKRVAGTPTLLGPLQSVTVKRATCFPPGGHDRQRWSPHPFPVPDAFGSWRVPTGIADRRLFQCHRFGEIPAW